MKEVWKCCWEVVPGKGEQTVFIPTLAAAKWAMRQKIAETVDLEDYISDLEPRVAEFLRNYLSDPRFPQSADQIPDDYEEPEYGELLLDAEYIHWEYPYDAFPCIKTNLVLDDPNEKEYHFHFWYEDHREAPKNSATALSITISAYTDYGTSAYPLMVLFALREEPQTQTQIARTIFETWETEINRKAIGRHLQWLADIGLPVEHGADGYYYGTEKRAPKDGVQYRPSAYPLLILEVLDDVPKKQIEITQAVQEKYGVIIDRKTVSRHLKLLTALGFNLLKKSKDGYYI